MQHLNSTAQTSYARINDHQCLECCSYERVCVQFHILRATINTSITCPRRRGHVNCTIAQPAEQPSICAASPVVQQSPTIVQQPPSSVVQQSPSVVQQPPSSVVQQSPSVVQQPPSSVVQQSPPSSVVQQGRKMLQDTVPGGPNSKSPQAACAVHACHTASMYNSI